jgi:hypothetical protein
MRALSQEANNADNLPKLSSGSSCGRERYGEWSFSFRGSIDRRIAEEFRDHPSA